MSNWTHKKEGLPKGRLRDRYICYTVTGGKDYYNIEIHTLKWMRAVYEFEHNTFTHWRELPPIPRG